MRSVPLVVSGWLVACLLSTDSALGADRPNIVLIMADDMGYSDLGCYGSEIATPHLDALAANGLRFTQFYNTGRCCPTRASLLTGLYPHQTGIGHMVQNRGQDGYRGDLNNQCLTIAQVLQPAGYATYCVGKWHVTPPPKRLGDYKKHNWPLQRGFDRYYGIINGASSFWDPNSLVRGNEPITCRADPDYQPDEPYHFTDAISDNAAAFIAQHSGEKPFFLYMPYTAPHWPMHARPADIAAYDGDYDVGYRAIRDARIARMRSLGVIPEGLKPSDIVGDWSKQKFPDWEADCMEVYAAMITQLDRGVGRVVEALERRGQLDNTLILFLQDNGGCAEDRNRNSTAKPRADKPSLPPIADDAVSYYNSQPSQTRDGYPVRRGRANPGPADTFISYGKNWANVSNTPFRLYKHYVHEGGIATPLVAHWPAGIGARGELRHEPSHLIDIMATCVDAAGADYPRQVDGTDILPLEGKSLLPVFDGEPLAERALYWEHERNQAVRLGDWKLVSKHRRDQPVKWELYNLAADRSELVDLASSEPQRAESMAALWQAYAERTAVVPRPGGKKKIKP